MTDTQTYTAFQSDRRIASGSLHDMKRASENGIEALILIFDDLTGRAIDIETEDVQLAGAIRGRGRPKLGVVAREVTLLPRHWEWLETQPGGASVALRKLVEEARRTNSDKDRMRLAQERAYRFMSAVAGNFSDFEEATRALFANDQARFREFVAGWPTDVRDYAIQLAFGTEEQQNDLY